VPCYKFVLMRKHSVSEEEQQTRLKELGKVLAEQNPGPSRSASSSSSDPQILPLSGEFAVGTLLGTVICAIACKKWMPPWPRINPTASAIMQGGVCSLGVNGGHYGMIEWQGKHHWSGSLLGALAGSLLALSPARGVKASIGPSLGLGLVASFSFSLQNRYRSQLLSNKPA